MLTKATTTVRIALADGSQHGRGGPATAPFL